MKWWHHIIFMVCFIIGLVTSAIIIDKYRIRHQFPTTEQTTGNVMGKIPQQLALTTVARNWIIIPEDSSGISLLGFDSLFRKDYSGKYHKVYRIVRLDDDEFYFYLRNKYIDPK